jgi:hypothetical protein
MVFTDQVNHDNLKPTLRTGESSKIILADMASAVPGVNRRRVRIRPLYRRPSRYNVLKLVRHLKFIESD